MPILRPPRTLSGGRFDRMRAVVLDSYGGPEVLRLREVPDPVIGPDEVLVDVIASGVNRADVLQRLGLYPYPGQPPQYDIPGLEFAGHIVAIGDRVGAVTVGDAVMGIVTGGGYASRVAVHERQVMVVPASTPVADAAAIPEVWITAFDALVVQGGLRPGDTALVHAGASGVGTAAIQLAKAAGARVIVTTSTHKVDRCLALGADVAVDYTRDDFVAACRAATDGRGVDVIVDVIGGEYLARNVDAAASRGRIVQVGVLESARASLNLGALMGKRLTLMGTVLRPRPIDEKIAITQRFAREVLPGFASGGFRPVIDARFSLEDAPAAHAMLEANATFGKIVLDV